MPVPAVPEAGLAGGGVAFLHPRKYHGHQQGRKTGSERAFTSRLDDGDIVLVDEITINQPKTKEVLAFLKNLQLGENVLILVDEYTENLDLGARNLPNVLVLKASSVNTYLMLMFKKIVITKAGLEALGSRLA